VNRADDPAGGPGWALRSFRGRFVPPHGVGRVGSDLKGRRLCLQLGRIVDGQFGWIDADNTFRPVLPGFNGAPNDCLLGEPKPGRRPSFHLESLLAGLAGGTPRLTRSVIWGTAGPRARSIRLHIGAAARDLKVGPDGTYIAFGPPDVYEPSVSADFTWAGGVRRHTPLYEVFERGMPPGAPPIPQARRRERPVLELRTPDPSGGVPWGVAAVHSTNGAWCTTDQVGRVVQDRVGSVDFLLGTFHESGGGPLGFVRCPQSGGATYRLHHPLTDLGWSGGGAVTQPGDDPEVGRVERRTLRGTVYIKGAVRDDVVAVTIATPRDVRTLQPSGRTHSFLAIYDGDFVTGKATITLRYRDGHTRTVEPIRYGDL
jgi:hypothetical protein